MDTKTDTIPIPARTDRIGSVSSDMDIFGCGNPIVDIMANVDDDFIQSHNLPKNGTVLAEVQQESLFDDIMNNYDIDYYPGGSVQNALRYCQWVVGKNSPVATYIGTVGDDYFGQILAKKVKFDGLPVKYQKVPTQSTAVCAILFSNDGKNKTIVTNLGASTKFDKTFLQNNFWFCERSRIIVCSGHLIPVSAESVMLMAKHAHEWGKDFFFNMGAPYVIQKYSNFLVDVFPYIDFLFCNAEEAIAFATMKGYHTKELKQVAKLIADEPKVIYDNPRISNNYKSGRVVVITQNEKPVLMAKSSKLALTDVKEYPVPPINAEEVKDNCGCGDALLGGFLAMYVDGQELEFCMKCGIYCASECRKMPACTLPRQMNFIS